MFLIRNGKITPDKELVFMPSGGIRGVAGIVSIVSGKDEKLPLVVLDSDKSGEDAKRKLVTGLYQGQDEGIIAVGDFTSIEQAEVEDLIPENLMNKFFDRMLFRDVDDTFYDHYDAGKPIVNQVQDFAKRYDVELPKGWKVDLSKSVKLQLQKTSFQKIPPKVLESWEELFEKLCK